MIDAIVIDYFHYSLSLIGEWKRGGREIIVQEIQEIMNVPLFPFS